MYTEAFERYVTAKNHFGHVRPDTYTRYHQIASAAEHASEIRSYNADAYVGHIDLTPKWCMNCGSYDMTTFNKVPKVWFTMKGKQKVMRIESEWTTDMETLCGKLKLSGDLLRIWERAGLSGSSIGYVDGMESLWRAARELDGEKRKDAGGSNSSDETMPLRLPEYVVETKTTCCGCAII